MNIAALLAENKALKEQCSLHQEQAKYALENLKLRTRQVEQQSQQIMELKDQVAQLQRMIFGSKSERFVYEDNQLNLFGDDQEVLESEAPVLVQTTISAHTRKINKNHPSRSLLKHCSHLRVEEQLIDTPHSAGDLLIGHLKREKLAYKPGEFFIKKLITPKYKKHQSEEIIVGEQPSEPIPKCEADVSLLSYIVVSKFVDHLPEYRQ